MKSNTRKKILALFAAGVLAVGGVAWAAVSAGTLSNTAVTGTPDMNAALSIPGTLADGYDLASDTVDMLGSLTLPAGNTYTTNPYNAVITSSWLGTINLGDGQILNLKPGLDGAIPRRLIGRATAPLATNIVAGSGVVGVGTTSGVLRLKGGTTNVYGGKANDPQTALEINNFDGGTFLAAGRLNVAHSNALGLGPITLGHGTTFGVIETSNVEVGRTAPDGTSLNNPQVFATPASATQAETAFRSPFTNVAQVPAVSGLYHQNILVRRHDNNTTHGIQNTMPVTFDVPTVATVKGVLRVHTGITQPLAVANSAPSAPDFSPVQAVKMGNGDMIVHAPGMQHTGGTLVKEGELFVDGGDTKYFVGELGNTWLVSTQSPVETSSPKINYNNYLLDRVSGFSEGFAWGARTNVLNETLAPFPVVVRSNNAWAPAYMNSFTQSLADPVRGGYVNPLTIEADGTVRVNRDQFIGDLNGAGTLAVVSWAKGGVEVIPQVVMQLNNTLSTNSGENAEFSGAITGKVNLVLDNPVQATGSGVNSDQQARRINFFPRIQALTGSNNITTGDTFVKDGTLSINKASNLGPGALRIGMYDTGYTTKNDGMTAGSANFRGFADTVNVATFHGLEDMTVNQPTIVYAPGLNLNAAVRNGSATDATVPSATTRSVTWYGNNPENVSGATLATGEIVGIDGRYNTVGPAVNLAATRGKTVGFSDIKLFGQNGAVPTIAQFSGKNDIRYIMRNAMAVNDKMDENPSWDGTVAFVASWDLAGATSARMFGFDVKAGTLQLSEVQQGGYALVGLRQGARISLGNNAREFGSNMQVVIEDDARICVKPQTTDLATSLAEAQTKNAVFMADSINYTGLGAGNDHMDKRLVVQIDLTNIGNAITDQWIKVVGSHNAVNWNNIHFYSSSAGQTEHLYKVKVAQPNNMVFDGNFSVTPYCDENQYNIYVHIKKIDQPTPSSNFTFDSTGTSVATNAKISGSATLKDNAGAPVASQDVTFYLFHAGVDYANNANAIESMTSKTDANGVASYLFDKGGYGNGAGYVIKAVATGYSDGTKAVTTTGGVTPGTSSSSGCDAGFGAFALLAMAGGALVLRKKD